MKRRIKATVRCSGRVIEVFPQKDKFIEVDRGTEWRADELDFAKDIDWKQVRIQATIAAMQGLIANPQTAEQIDHDDGYKKIRGGDKTQLVAIAAVMYANALIAELQKKDELNEELNRMSSINGSALVQNMTDIGRKLQKKGGQDD